MMRASSLRLSEKLYTPSLSHVPAVLRRYLRQVLDGGREGVHRLSHSVQTGIALVDFLLQLGLTRRVDPRRDYRGDYSRISMSSTVYGRYLCMHIISPISGNGGGHGYAGQLVLG